MAKKYQSQIKKKQTGKCILTHIIENRRTSLRHKELIKTNNSIEKWPAEDKVY